MYKLDLDKMSKKYRGVMFNGCHKIYLIQKRETIADFYNNYGYEPSDYYTLDSLKNIWEDSCPLRFIQVAESGVDLIPQCTEDNQIEWIGNWRA